MTVARRLPNLSGWLGDRACGAVALSCGRVGAMTFRLYRVCGAGRRGIMRMQLTI